MAQQIAAAVAFFALGASLLGTGLLLLFNPHSRGVRWFALFMANITVWLLVQGVAFASGDWARWGPIHAGVVHMLPGTFLAAVLVDSLNRPLREVLGVLALAVLLLPAFLRPFGLITLGELIWQIVGWGAGSFLMWRCARRDLFARAGDRLGTTIVVSCLAVPVIVAGAMVLSELVEGSHAFFIFAMPLIVVALQFVIFLGVVHLRFYNIEVRAARSGELAAKAAEVERLALLGELSASLAHEVRNPLTGVRSLAQRLAEDEVEDGRRRRYAGIILDELGRVERIVLNLLGLARRGTAPGQGEARTALGPLFEDLLLLVRSRAEKARVTLVADASGLNAPVLREALAQALLNLVLNAIAHSPAGGRVELLARGDGDHIRILVRDQGPGVPAGERDRIFEPFYSRTGSTGLGLAVVRRLAGELGWSVSVRDAPGSGAQFELSLPRQHDTPKSPGIAQSPVAAQTTP